MYTPEMNAPTWGQYQNQFAQPTISLSYTILEKDSVLSLVPKMSQRGITTNIDEVDKQSFEENFFRDPRKIE